MALDLSSLRKAITAHTCDDDQAARVYAVAGRFLADARTLLQRLDERND